MGAPVKFPPKPRCDRGGVEIYSYSVIIFKGEMQCMISQKMGNTWAFVAVKSQCDDRNDQRLF